MHHTLSTKQVRRNGPPENCDHCATPTAPPDVIRSGSESTRFLHPSCAEADALSAIRDAGVARELQRDADRRPDLRLINRSKVS